MTGAYINARAASVQKATAKPHHFTGLDHMARFPCRSYIAVIHYGIRVSRVAVLLRLFRVKSRYGVGIVVAIKAQWIWKVKITESRLPSTKCMFEHFSKSLSVETMNGGDRRMAGDVKWLEALSEQSD